METNDVTVYVVIDKDSRLVLWIGRACSRGDAKRKCLIYRDVLKFLSCPVENDDELDQYLSYLDAILIEDLDDIKWVKKSRPLELDCITFEDFDHIKWIQEVWPQELDGDCLLEFIKKDREERRNRNKND